MAVVAGFYRRVAEDPILRPLYPDDDLDGAEHRLRSFLIYRFGGPPTQHRDYLERFLGDIATFLINAN